MKAAEWNLARETLFRQAFFWHAANCFEEFRNPKPLKRPSTIETNTPRQGRYEYFRLQRFLRRGNFITALPKTVIYTFYHQRVRVRYRWRRDWRRATTAEEKSLSQSASPRRLCTLCFVVHLVIHLNICTQNSYIDNDDVALVSEISQLYKFGLCFDDLVL